MNHHYHRTINQFQFFHRPFQRKKHVQDVCTNLMYAAIFLTIVKSLDKIRDIICVLHGIGPDGCDSVGSISMKLRNELLEEGKLEKVKIGNPHIELWHGLPTLHCAIQKA